VAHDDHVRDFIRFVQAILSSLRRTLEVPFEAQLRQKENEAASLFREMLRDLESARLSIAPLRMRPSNGLQSGAVTYLAALSRELTKMIENHEYGPILRSLRYRRLSDPSVVRSEVRVPNIEAAYEAIIQLIGKISEFASPPGTALIQRELFQLQAIVPAQKIAPAQFEIRNSRLIVRRVVSRSKDEDLQNIQSAKSELQQAGNRIIHELQRSNCDKRLLENIQRLQDQLLDETDAIKIGLTNLSCEFMCSAFDHELPSAVS
jgi:hypothetical protein